MMDIAVPAIRLSARCYPTEDGKKVSRAILNIFPESKLEGEDPIIGTTSSLENFRELLRRQRIRSAARTVFIRGIRGGSLTFSLNKQVAAVGKVSFSEESQPLGAIEVVIESEDAEALIERLLAEPEREVGP